ncbi:family 43 glycosylhydrolase [Draconibacterium halophilum]|uniref:Family 43 glycosylhydrolase n=1 Tax=Draconibacterium halophilum TaxID=2706887 RepID=A0A6C0RHK4_9BACT|nr:family 43 glycosylhydrolase [Draconibacterium halophilum]QIA09145.1 family 43 glycosylhydrolase [Draconibacterium halophilum]
MKKTSISLYLIIIVLHCFFLEGHAQQFSSRKQTAICNPLNLNYRFALFGRPAREGADPTIVLFKNKYYLFASKSGGYWSSVDLTNWSFITSTDLPWEDYAPTAVVIKDTLYFLASTAISQKRCIYKTANPDLGKWTVANPDFPIKMTDPDLFLDDDGRLYLFYGCSNKEPIYAVELDVQTLNPIGKTVDCFNSNMDVHGWERNGDYNTSTERPWMEGPWMNKYKGKYYLQYAAPGTEYRSYSDGLYIADSPLGPYKVADLNPFSYKPEGFIAGAGHGSTFQDKYGNFWHIATMSISINRPFERRLGLFPAFFDNEGTFYTYTAFGDFPHIIPQRPIQGPEDYQPSWMLFSFNKPVEVSSTFKDYGKEKATDENVRTWWSAETGAKGEWITVDLEHQHKIGAIQINFADVDSKIKGRHDSVYYAYMLEYSVDKKTWNTLTDKRTNRTDVPHDYIEFDTPVSARYIKLTNEHVPGGNFSISDLRVFGIGSGKLPQVVSSFSVIRDITDGRNVTLSWKKKKDAIGYNIRYGIQPDKLYLNYQVLNTDSVTIHSLNSQQAYYFTIDAFNENGITKGKKIVGIKY